MPVSLKNSIIDWKRGKTDEKETGRRNDLNGTASGAVEHGGTHRPHGRSADKAFYGFFPTEGNSLEYGNIMKAKIAEVTGAECEELWLSGQTKEQALNSYIASGRYPDFIQGEKTYTKQRH